MKTKLIVLLLFIAPIILAAQSKDYTVIKDSLNGSKIQIVVPQEWNKNILIIAHGYNPENYPLSADFSPENSFLKKLIQNGWIIASTSYRRNGMIIKDAVEDIGFLRDFICTEYGASDTVIVAGTSMGGAIGAVIAETKFQDYTGVLAISAALRCQDEEEPYLYNYNPPIPIVYLSLIGESGGPDEYISALKKSSAQVVLYTVERAGHSNVNHLEYETAFKGLLDLINGKAVEGRKDVTSIIKNESVAIFSDGGAYTKVLQVSTKYGSFNTDIIPEDMEKLNIKKGEYFFVSYNDNKFKILYGNAYSDVERGEWVAFFTAGGYLKIARNFADARASLECKEKDVIFISNK